MAKPRGLGRGLGALIPGEDNTTPHNSVADVDILLIDPDTEQPRKHFDEEALASLASSIRTHGVVQPIVLRPENGRYRIIAGERRWRAARLAGLTTLPAVIKDVQGRDAMEIALIENVQREDLNPVEEAQALQALLQEHGLTQEALSERLGKSRSAIANTLRLLQLPAALLEGLRTGALTSGHARALLALPSAAAQLEAAQIIRQKSLSVRQTEQLVKRMNEAPSAPPTPAPRAVELGGMEDMLREAFGTKVSLTGTLQRGRVVIEYFDRDALEHIYTIASQATGKSL